MQQFRAELKNTPRSTSLAPCSVSSGLNREGTLSVQNSVSKLTINNPEGNQSESNRKQNNQRFIHYLKEMVFSQIQNKLDKTGNATFSLIYHFITVVKYRKQIFTRDDIISDLKNVVNQKAENFDIEIIEQECGIDHIHILFRAKPTTEITKFINAIKGHTSRELRKKYKDFLNEELWGDCLWSPSYFLASAGNVSIDTLQQYVAKQRSFGNEEE